MYLVKTPAIIKLFFKGMTWNIPNEENTIFLTFDDGPTPEITTWVLSTLKQFDAKATFFCVGANAEKHPGILKQITDEGHSLGIHSYNHLNGRNTSDKDFLEDIEKCAALIDSRLFRPPYGKLTKAQSKSINQRYSIIMWDVLSGDFDQSINGEKCFLNVKNNAKSGSIIVFHDSVKAEQNLRFALPATLSYFKDKGCGFGAIPTAI